MVIVPPYFGVPRLSHQFPVAEVVVEVVVVTVVVDTVFVVDVVDVGLDVVVVVDVDVVVDVAQDATRIEATIKQLKNNHANFFPIISPSCFKPI